MNPLTIEIASTLRPGTKLLCIDVPLNKNILYTFMHTVGTKWIRIEESTAAYFPGRFVIVVIGKQLPKNYTGPSEGGV